MFGVPIDPDCKCPTCQHHDRAYLWHLVKAKEPVSIGLISLHNIQYMNDLMARIREDIMNDKI